MGRIAASEKKDWACWEASGSDLGAGVTPELECAGDTGEWVTQKPWQRICGCPLAVWWEK